MQLKFDYVQAMKDLRVQSFRSRNTKNPVHHVGVRDFLQPSAEMNFTSVDGDAIAALCAERCAIPSRQSRSLRVCRQLHDCRRKGCKTESHEKQAVFRGFLLF